MRVFVSLRTKRLNDDKQHETANINHLQSLLNVRNSFAYLFGSSIFRVQNHDVCVFCKRLESLSDRAAAVARDSSAHITIVPTIHLFRITYFLWFVRFGFYFVIIFLSGDSLALSPSHSARSFFSGIFRKWTNCYLFISGDRSANARLWARQPAIHVPYRVIQNEIWRVELLVANGTKNPTYLRWDRRTLNTLREQIQLQMAYNYIYMYIRNVNCVSLICNDCNRIRYTYLYGVLSIHTAYFFAFLRSGRPIGLGCCRFFFTLHPLT